MGSRYKEHNPSEVACMKELLSHDPRLRNRSKEYKRSILESADRGEYRVEAAFENAIAQVGKLIPNPDSIGPDYLHGQGDAKWISLGYCQTVTKKKLSEGVNPYYSYQTQITNIHRKYGPLRIGVYHPKYDEVEYFLVKEKIWKSWVNKSGGIVIKYNKRTGCLGRLEEYKVSFKELCQKV